MKILEPKAIAELRAKHQSAMINEDNIATIDANAFAPNLKAVINSQISTIQVNEEYSDMK